MPSATRRRSLSGVVVKSIDAGAVRRAMDAYAARLLTMWPEIEEIIVFGSFAEGNWAPGSDLDVFLILSHGGLPVRDRVPRYLPGAFPVGIDLFPFTRAEMVDRAPSPLLDSVARSRWRYARSAASETGGTRTHDDDRMTASPFASEYKVVAQLKRNAARHRRSLEGELRAVLSQAARLSPDDKRAISRESGQGVRL